MVRYCCVVGCKSASHDRQCNKMNHDLRFFAFPTMKTREGPHVEEVTKRRRMAWVSAVRRPEITFDNIPGWRVVCSLHFHSGKPSYEMAEAHPDWVPSVSMGHSETKTSNANRFERQKERNKKQAEWLVKAAEKNEEKRQRKEREATLKEAVTSHTTTETQTDLTGIDMPQFSADHLHGMQEEINRLLDENRKLKEDLRNKEFTEDSFREDDNKIRYFTGLPSFATFLVLFNHLQPHLPQCSRRIFSPFQLLMITFMRLRLNLPVQYLAYQYGVHRQTITNAFMETIAVMYTHLCDKVCWPDRESLRMTMPHQFQEAFGKHVAVIIDCFENFIERPANLKAQSQTFSSYKHNNTMKYLIGVTPLGAVSFISKGWGGRASDKHITENCGFLDNLLPGNIVLADRGFDIKESVGLLCAEVKIPAFMKGKAQMHAKDVEDTRQIAHLRIHVERVIGNIQGKYRILSDTLPIHLVLPCDGEQVTILDKIVRVCCALTNTCPGVV